MSFFNCCKSWENKPQIKENTELDKPFHTANAIKQWSLSRPGRRTTASMNSSTTWLLGEGIITFLVVFCFYRFLNAKLAVHDCIKRQGIPIITSFTKQHVARHLNCSGEVKKSYVGLNYSHMTRKWWLEHKTFDIVALQIDVGSLTLCTIHTKKAGKRQQSLHCHQQVCFVFANLVQFKYRVPLKHLCNSKNEHWSYLSTARQDVSPS